MRRLTRVEFEELCDLYGKHREFESEDLLTFIEWIKRKCREMAWPVSRVIELLKRCPPPDSKSDDISEEYNRQITRHIHDQGIEMTPDQVREYRRIAFRKIRLEMAKRGWELPEKDSEMIEVLRRLK
jgi:hypothetical protein